MRHEVERVSRDASGLPERLDHGDAPLLIEGGAKHWPACTRWSPSYLLDRLGPIEIAFKTSTSNAHPDFRQPSMAQMFARNKSTLDEFFRLIGSGRADERSRHLFTGDERHLLRRRLGETQVDPALGPLLSDIEVPRLFPENRLYTVWAWFSGPKVRTWLHYDNNGCHNLNAQVTGRKRCVLYAPDELRKMHPFPFGGDNPAHNCSRIDVEDPACDVADDLAAATAHHAELEAGDVLFIPAFWFHTFEHLGEFNANVNFWWKPRVGRWSVVSARQAFIDSTLASGVDMRDPSVRAVLRRIDAAAVARQTGG